MTRKRRSTKGDNRPHYVALHHWFMRTDAWRDLDCVARCTYVELSRRYGGPGSNNGKLPCSVRDISEALQVGKATAHKALASLQEHGFAVLVRRGSFNFKVRHATEWRLTEFGCDVTGTLPTKDFTRWEKKHGSATEPHRYPTPNGSVPPAERGKPESPVYGSAAEPVEQDHGSATGTLVVYQGVSKSPPPHFNTGTRRSPQSNGTIAYPFTSRSPSGWLAFLERRLRRREPIAAEEMHTFLTTVDGIIETGGDATLRSWAEGVRAQLEARAA